MNEQEHMQLVQENVVPHLSGKLFIADEVICISQTDTMKLFYTLKYELSSDNQFLCRELKQEYIRQVQENFAVKNFKFNFSLMPYASKHGIIKQLRKMINE